MGLFDFFERRRRRESAVPSREMEAFEALPGETAEPEAEPEPVGRMQSGPDVQPINVHLRPPVDVAQVIGMVGQALRTGELQAAHSESRVVNLDDSGLREEILAAMREQGIDPGASAGGEVSAADFAGLQERILQALESHGVDLDEHGADAPWRRPADGDDSVG